MALGSGPRRQSFSMTSTCRPNCLAIFIHRKENQPLSNIRILSPGDKVLTSAASPAPVPEDGKMNTSAEVVLKTFFIPPKRVNASRENFWLR